MSKQKHPKYTILRGRTYWLNLRLPEAYSGSHLRISLQTENARVAATCAQTVSLRLRLFTGSTRSMSFSLEQLRRLADQWLAEELENIEHIHAIHLPTDLEQAGQQEEMIGEYLSAAREALSNNDAEYMAKETLACLEDEGLDTDKNSHAYKRLRLELNQRQISAYEAHKGLFDGKPIAIPQAVNLPQSLPTSPPEKDGDKLSVVYEEYRQEMINSQAWGREKTATENVHAFAVLLELINDIPINKFDKELARSYKKDLQRYPVSRKKKTSIRDKSLAEIWNSGMDYNSISATTVSNQMTKVGGFFSWAHRNGYLDSNVMEGLKVKQKGKRKEDRESWTPEDLKVLFSTPIHTEHKYKYAYYFWLPLIGLFTGARIEEICQMRPEDVREVEGVLCFSITDEQEDQQLKNETSKRSIPVHPHLLELGLLSYLEERKTSGETMLFSGLNRHGEKHSHYASKWFSKFKRGLGFDNKKKVFHSFRHTMTDALRSNRAHDYEIKSILGHSTGTATHDVYGGSGVAGNGVLQEVDFREQLQSVKPRPPIS